MDLENRFIIYDDLSVVDKIDLETGQIFTSKSKDDAYFETYELHTLFDQSDNSFYFIADSLKNVEHLCKKLNDKENIILTLEERNKNLCDENHRLRLTLIHQEDLRNDIKWLKENIGRIEEHG